MNKLWFPYTQKDANDCFLLADLDITFSNDFGHHSEIVISSLSPA